MKNQNGMTMIEMMVTLVIILVVTGFLLRYAPALRDGWRASSLVTNVTQFHGMAVGSCGNGDCTSINSQVIVDSKKLLEFHNQAGSEVISVTGSPVVFGPANIGTGTGNGLSQTHADIGDRVCVIAAENIWSSVSLLNINGVAVKTTISQPVDNATINTNCASNLNSMEFIFKV